MGSGFIDNRTALVKDDLVRTIRAGDRISVASSLFSMYAYRELREQLESVGGFRFIFTSKSFVREKTPKEQRVAGSSPAGPTENGRNFNDSALLVFRVLGHRVHIGYIAFSGSRHFSG